MWHERKITTNICILGDTYPKWPKNFKWVSGSGNMMILKKVKGFKCATFKEPKDSKSNNKYLCWKGDTATKIKFSASGRF